MEPAVDVAVVEGGLAGLTEEVGGHDWVQDPFARETWATYSPGTLLSWLPELERMEDRIAFAGSDIARGWISYMDGAIETGLRATREIEAVLP